MATRTNGLRSPKRVLVARLWRWRGSIEWHPEVHFVPAGRPANEKFLAMVAAELAKNPGKAKVVLEAMRQRTETRMLAPPSTTLRATPDSVELLTVKLPQQLPPDHKG